MREYIKTIGILAIPLAIYLIYAISPYNIDIAGYRLQKIDLSDVINRSSASTFQDTMQAKSDSILAARQEMPVDTARKRILIFGDSMVEGLTPRLSEYCAQNGHTLYSVCWYGSTTVGWVGRLDSLRSYVAWASPDYIMVSLGGNELQTRDIQRRKQSVMQIMEVIGNRPCVWIATPSWVDDPTIIDVERSVVGQKRFYDSTKLSFQRRSDHMHPTAKSFNEWMDSIAVWLSSQETAHPIMMEKPAKRLRRIWNGIIIGTDGIRRGGVTPVSQLPKSNAAARPEESQATTDETHELPAAQPAPSNTPAAPATTEGTATQTE